MPSIVAGTVAPQPQTVVRSCGLCHYPNGKGRPENAGVPVCCRLHLGATGRLQKWRAKNRGSGKRNTAVMSGNAAGITDEEAMAAAQYFSLDEDDPLDQGSRDGNSGEDRNVGGFFVPLEGKETEPIGQRILKCRLIPRLTRCIATQESGWIAYAPMGSVKKARTWSLEARGQDSRVRRMPWRGFEGNGNFPHWRAVPSYLARQLYDIQKIYAQRPGTQLMRQLFRI